MAGLMKGSILSFSAACALAIFVNSSAYGVSVTENFNDNPAPRGWLGSNSSPDPTISSPPSTDPDGGGALIANDYGFKATDDTGSAVNPPAGGGVATGAGEIGGVMNRAGNSFYGVNLGGAVDFNTVDMNVKGVLRQMQAKGSSTLNLGWSKGIATLNAGTGNVDSALFVSWDDGANGSAPGMRGRSSTGSGIGTDTAVPNLVTGDPTRPFEFNWNSTTNVFSFTLGGVTSNMPALTEADVTALGDLTHWGLWGRVNSSPDDAGNQLRIDDVTYTTPNAIPEPASLGLLSLGGLALIRRRRA